MRILPTLVRIVIVIRQGEKFRPVASVTIVCIRILTVVESRFQLRITAVLCSMDRLPAR